MPGRPQPDLVPSCQRESGLTSSMQNKSDAASMDGCHSSCSQCIWKGSFSCLSLVGLSHTNVTQSTGPHIPRDSHMCRRTAWYHCDQSKHPSSSCPMLGHKVLPTCMQLGNSNMDTTCSRRQGSLFVLVSLPVEHKVPVCFCT